MQFNTIPVKLEPHVLHAGIYNAISIDKVVNSHSTISSGHLNRDQLLEYKQPNQSSSVVSNLSMIDQLNRDTSRVMRESYTPQVVSQIPSSILDSVLPISCTNDSILQQSINRVSLPTSFHQTNKNETDFFDGRESITGKVVQAVKPSEALFVRALVGRCKRIAPLWFRGVSSMRERNREENRRMANSNGQSQNDWRLIGMKIAVSKIFHRIGTLIKFQCSTSCFLSANHPFFHGDSHSKHTCSVMKSYIMVSWGLNDTSLIKVRYSLWVCIAMIMIG